MFATIRRYEGVDQNRTVELTGKVNETLVPKLSNLDGFKGYYLIEAGNGIFSSLGLFETSEQADESTKVAASWLQRREARDCVPEPAQDHERQGCLAQERRHCRVVDAFVGRACTNGVLPSCARVRRSTSVGARRDPPASPVR